VHTFEEVSEREGRNDRQRDHERRLQTVPDGQAGNQPHKAGGRDQDRQRTPKVRQSRLIRVAGKQEQGRIGGQQERMERARLATGLLHYFRSSR